MAKERKYGKVTTERGKIPEDEPVFLFRAQDEYASAVLRFYASLRQTGGDGDGAHRVLACAREFDGWGTKKKPD